jgi:hypothetical protein
MATTTTAIELQPHADNHVTRTTAAAASTTYAAVRDDDVMQASLVADSEVPDGGYGWVVIFASAVITFWFVGTTYCWGVFQAALVQEGVSSASTLAFVGSLTTACISFLAVLNARVIRKLGPRLSGCLGISLFGFGEMMAGFATTDIVGLFMTVGLVMGLGTRYVRWLKRNESLASKLTLTFHQSIIHGKSRQSKVNENCLNGHVRSFPPCPLSISRRNEASPMVLSMQAVELAAP